jgi:hypothetical protein
VKLAEFFTFDENASGTGIVSAVEPLVATPIP